MLMMPFSAFAFHHSKGHNSACQQKKAVEDKSIVMKLCERRKKIRTIFECPDCSELCNVSAAHPPQPGFCKGQDLST